MTSPRRNSRRSPNYSNNDIDSLLVEDMKTPIKIDKDNLFIIACVFIFYLILAYFAYRIIYKTIDVENNEVFSKKFNWWASQNTLFLIISANLCLMAYLSYECIVKKHTNMLFLSIIAALLSLLYLYTSLDQKRSDISFWILCVEIVLISVLIYYHKDMISRIMLILSFLLILYCTVFNYSVASNSLLLDNGVFFFSSKKIN